MDGDTFMKFIRDSIINIEDQPSILQLWKLLPYEIQYSIAQGLQPEVKIKLIPAIFDDASLEILDILITPDIINNNFSWILIKKNPQHLRRGMTPLDPILIWNKTFEIWSSEGRLIEMAIGLKRIDLLIFLFERNATITDRDLQFIAEGEHDEMKILIDYTDLTDKNKIIKILANIVNQTDFDYLAAKAIFLGYERSDFEEAGYESPIEQDLANKDGKNIEHLLNLGIKIEPDASYYIESYKDLFSRNPELLELFVNHGGDRTIIKLQNRTSIPMTQTRASAQPPIFRPFSDSTPIFGPFSVRPIPSSIDVTPPVPRPVSIQSPIFRPVSVQPPIPRPFSVQTPIPRPVSRPVSVQTPIPRAVSRPVSAQTPIPRPVPLNGNTYGFNNRRYSDDEDDYYRDSEDDEINSDDNSEDDY